MTACAAVVTCVLNEAGAKPATRSPTARSSTPGPTAWTMPAHSSPKVGPANPSISASSGNSPIAHITSRKLRPAAWTSIATSPGPGERGTIVCHPSASSPLCCAVVNAAMSVGAAQRGGRPRRSRSTKRPLGVQTISVSAVSAASSAAIFSARASGLIPGGRSISRSLSRWISLTSTRPKPHNAAPTSPASALSPACCAPLVTSHSGMCRSAAAAATRATKAISCVACATASALSSTRMTAISRPFSASESSLAAIEAKAVASASLMS